MLIWLDDGGQECHVKDKPLACLKLFTHSKNDVRDVAGGAFLENLIFLKKYQSFFKKQSQYFIKEQRTISQKKL